MFDVTPIPKPDQTDDLEATVSGGPAPQSLGFLPAPPPCRPPWWARGAHAQTLLGHWLTSRVPELPWEILNVKLADGDALRYAVKLIGYCKGKSVIVSTPTVDNKFAFIRDGQSFVVRFFRGKVAYAFATSVFKSTNVPYPHLHLTYPSTVRGLVVRRGARARVNIIAAAVDARGKSHAATLCDLSTGGGMLVGNVQMGEVGETLTLKFRAMLNGQEHYLHPVAAIRNIGTGDGSAEGLPAGFHHGLQFVEVPPSETLALTTLVYEKLLQESAEI